MFKEASEKKLVTYEGDPTKLSAHFLEEIYKPQKSGLYVQKAERKKKTTKQQYYIWQNYF